MKIYFKNLHLIIANDFPAIEDFVGLQKKASAIHYSGDQMYEFVQHTNKDDNYYWLYGEFDNYTIYAPDIINKDTEKKEANPKQPNQIELKNQVFLLYDLNSGTLYLSNMQKKSVIEEYLTHTLQKDVLVRNIYTSVESFEKTLKALKEIRFTAVDNLFKTPNGVFEYSC